MRLELGLLTVIAFAVAACATRSPPPSPRPAAPAAATPAEAPTPAPAAGSPPSSGEVRPPPARPNPEFASLEGWDQDDHSADFQAFTAGCSVSRNPNLAELCHLALAQGPLDEAAARAFLEAHFEPEPIVGEGLLTGYFTPEYEARTEPEGEFTAPVRPRPSDLPRRATHVGEVPNYPDRASIEARPAPDALAWMRPEDLFFLQIQGSGALTFPDGTTRRAVFDGSNGKPFLGVAAPMRQAGLLVNQDTSADRIRAWLAANRGPRANAIMDLDRRYVFFHLELDDGVEPSGAAGVKLTPGRMVAVDPTQYAMGDVLWIDAEAPSLSGAFPAYRRLVMAMDTGSAIRGPVRADLYLGRGPDAGVEAGRIRHRLHLYRLAPRDAGPS